MLRYAITDRRLLAGRSGHGNSGAPSATGHQDADGWEGVLAAQAAVLASRGDVDYLQLREKDLPAGELAALARRILAVLRAHDPARRAGSGPKLLINSRADVAIAVGADGVHLTSSGGELTPAQVRSLYSKAGMPPPTVSLSCHTLADVIAARGLRSEDELCFAPDPATAPDLILFGPVFEKCAGDMLIAEGSGLDLLRQAAATAAPIPVLALGGTTEENAADCLAAGAAGIAAIRLYFL